MTNYATQFVIFCVPCNIISDVRCNTTTKRTALLKEKTVLVEYLRCYILEDETETGGSLMPLLCSTPLHTPALDSLLMSFFSAENRIYREYYRRNPLRLDTIIRVIFKNSSPDYNLVRS
jgi:hypothetical protein